MNLHIHRKQRYCWVHSLQLLFDHLLVQRCSAYLKLRNAHRNEALLFTGEEVLEIYLHVAVAHVDVLVAKVPYLLIPLWCVFLDKRQESGQRLRVLFSVVPRNDGCQLFLQHHVRVRDASQKLRGALESQGLIPELRKCI